MMKVKENDEIIRKKTMTENYEITVCSVLKYIFDKCVI